MCSHSLRHHRGHALNPLDLNLSNGGVHSSQPTAVSPNSREESEVVEEEDLDSLEGSSSMLMDSPQSSMSLSLPRSKDNQKEEDELLMADTAPQLMSQVKVKPGHELKLKCDLNNTYGRIIWLLNGNAIRTDNGR